MPWCLGRGQSPQPLLLPERPARHAVQPPVAVPLSGLGLSGQLSTEGSGPRAPSVSGGGWAQSICQCVHVCAHTRVCVGAVYMYVWVCMCVDVCMCMCGGRVHVCGCACVCTAVCAYLCGCVHVCAHVCVNRQLRDPGTQQAHWVMSGLWWGGSPQGP